MKLAHTELRYCLLATSATMAKAFTCSSTARCMRASRTVDCASSETAATMAWLTRGIATCRTAGAGAKAPLAVATSASKQDAVHLDRTAIKICQPVV